MSETLDELTYDYEDDGILVRKQLDRVVLTHPGSGGWATVMFLYQELDPAKGTFRAPKMAIVRFQKWKGGYRKHSSFNVPNAAQARVLAEVFARWIPTMSPDAVDGELGAEG